MLTTVTTCRKFFTILASVVFFGHQLKALQWFGVGLVFTGLSLEVVESYQKKAKSH